MSYAQARHDLNEFNRVVWACLDFKMEDKPPTEDQDDFYIEEDWKDYLNESGQHLINASLVLVVAMINEARKEGINWEENYRDADFYGWCDPRVRVPAGPIPEVKITPSSEVLPEPLRHREWTAQFPIMQVRVS